MVKGLYTPIKVQIKYIFPCLCGIVPRSDQNKDYDMCVWSLSAENAAFMKKRKVWLLHSQDVHA